MSLQVSDGLAVCGHLAKWTPDVAGEGLGFDLLSKHVLLLGSRYGCAWIVPFENIRICIEFPALARDVLAALGILSGADFARSSFVAVLKIVAVLADICTAVACRTSM